GRDPSGQPRDVFANVTPLTASTNGVPSQIHASADGFKPCTAVTFRVRFPFPAESGPAVSGNALPLTGSQTGFLVAVGATTILIGIALVQGASARANRIS